MTPELQSDAHDMAPSGLLRAAARLVERALIKLDMTEAPCPHCAARLFENMDAARVYEQLTDLPEKLRNAAERVEGSIQTDGRPRRSSRGFLDAMVKKTAAQ